MVYGDWATFYAEFSAPIATAGIVSLYDKVAGEWSKRFLSTSDGRLLCMVEAGGTDPELQVCVR